MIVFGHNSFLLHQAKPSQLGLPVELDEQFNIEHRQRYFHLFWIPTFSIGKIWALRKKSDNQLYEPNAPIEQFLNALPLQQKTPWYTYSFLILALVVGIIGTIYMRVEDYLNERRHHAYLEKEFTDRKNSVNNITPFHYFKLRGSDGENLSLKVLSASKDSVGCKYTLVNGDYSEYSLLELFSDEAQNEVHAISIARTDLLKTVRNPNDEESDGYPIIPEHGKFWVDEIREFPHPVFENNSAAYEEGKFQLTLRNIGPDAEFDSLYAVKSSISFEGDPFPKKVKHGEYLVFEGSYTDVEPILAARVWFHNNAGQPAEFVWAIAGSRTTLRLKQ